MGKKIDWVNRPRGLASRKIPRKKWQWSGSPAHHVERGLCRWWLVTRIGDYIVSSIGQWLASDGVGWKYIEGDHYYEIVVFEAEETTGFKIGLDLWRRVADVAEEAESIHANICRKIGSGYYPECLTFAEEEERGEEMDRRVLQGMSEKMDREVLGGIRVPADPAADISEHVREVKLNLGRARGVLDSEQEARIEKLLDDLSDEFGDQGPASCSGIAVPPLTVVDQRKTVSSLTPEQEAWVQTWNAVAVTATKVGSGLTVVLDPTLNADKMLEAFRERWPK